MSTHPGFADSDPEPDTDQQPTAQYPVGFGEDPTTQLTAETPPVVPPPDLEAPANATAGLMTAASSDRCNNCGAQLAPDQHYCVVCGERRGRARFAGAMFAPTSAPEPAGASAGGAPNRSTRWPPAATLIAGVATLLVAVGLGILIGHDSSKTVPSGSGKAPIVNLYGNGSSGSSAGSSTGASTTASSNSTSSKSTKATKSSTKAAPKVSAAAAQKSAAAASKVLGASSKNAPPPTVQQGQACTHGAGCQGGKFTGNFFGG